MKTKIVFFGSAALSLACLKYLYHSNDFEIVGVVCQPDKPNGRNHKITFGPVKQFCLENQILCLQPNKVNVNLSVITKLHAQIGACVAYGQKIGQTLLDSFPLGIINVHPSTLPKYRGAAPINYAIWNNDPTTSICIMKMEQTMDTGPVCLKHNLIIEPGMTAGDLLAIVSKLAPKLLHDALLDIINNQVVWTEQDKKNVYPMAPMLKKVQEQIDWNQPAQTIVSHINAFSPTPATYTYYHQTKLIKFYKALIGSHHHDQVAGKINRIEKDFICITSVTPNSCVHLSEFLIPGKKKIQVKDYHGTYPFQVGDQFNHGN